MSGVDKIVDSHNLSENDETGNVSTDRSTSEEEWEIYESAEEDFAAEHQPLDISGGCFDDVHLTDIERPNEMGIFHEEDIGNSGTDNPPPERKISDCIEALESFSDETRCGLGSSSNSARSISPTDNKVIFIENPGENGSGGFEEIVYNVTIKERDIVETLITLQSGHYTVSVEPAEPFYTNCKYLFEKDYHCEYVDNFGGILSKNYPVRLIVPIKRKSAKEGSKGAPEFDKIQYAEMVKSSVNARIRRRFVAPVILFDDKLICRSGTLSVRKSAIYESSRQPETPKEVGVEDNWIERGASNIFQIIARTMKIAEAVSTHIFDPSSMEKIRRVDRNIMKSLNMEYICDLTIEKRKMFLNLIPVGSSEKINTDIYDFKIDQMPYPGCRFFERYSRVHRDPDGLIFNWERADCNTELLLSELNDFLSNIDWHDYKKWDVIVLTKNYLKIMLSRLIEGTGGLLVHCISGWDRTPLMISLLRVSLWADGVAHQNLTLVEMAYLTLAYDWYLFGHNFPDRKQKREEIMHFCFNFLTRIATDEFSIIKMVEESSCLERYEGKFPAFEPGRREVLKDFSVLVLNIYDQHIRFPVV